MQAADGLGVPPWASSSASGFNFDFEVSMQERPVNSGSGAAAKGPLAQIGHDGTDVPTYTRQRPA